MVILLNFLEVNNSFWGIFIVSGWDGFIWYNWFGDRMGELDFKYWWSGVWEFREGEKKGIRKYKSLVIFNNIKEMVFFKLGE